MPLRPSHVNEAVEVEKLIVVDSLRRETSIIIIYPIKAQRYLVLLD